ncbi:MAG: 50S ribosomal protein L10 [Deltaproteobacteria bacterium]|nr:50S ribosomal protein L10 [Deltaproteobacteria bacterium]
MNREQKDQVVQDLHKRFARAKAVVLTNFSGLTVEKMSRLRDALREGGVEYKVVKNSLMNLAAKDTGVSRLKDHFSGPAGVAISYDEPITMAKVLADFAKAEDKFSIKVGYVDGNVFQGDEIVQFSKLPSREVLLGRLLGTMNAVPTGLVSTLNQIIATFLRALQAIADKKEGSALPE